MIALLIEVRLSKEEILELYLNRVYLSAGVYGVEAMSQHLYRKNAGSLTLSEAAFIAGLLRAPSALSPWTNYDGALERSHLVLAADARAEIHHGRAGDGRAAANVRAFSLIDRRRIRAPAGPRTTCVSSFATSSAATIRRTGRCTRASSRRFRRPRSARSRQASSGSAARGDPPLEAALVALDPRTGNILAMVGGIELQEEHVQSRDAGAAPGRDRRSSPSCTRRLSRTALHR